MSPMYESRLLCMQVDAFDRLGNLPNIGTLDPEWLKEQYDWIDAGGEIRSAEDEL